MICLVGFVWLELPSSTFVSEMGSFYQWVGPLQVFFKECIEPLGWQNYKVTMTGCDHVHSIPCTLEYSSFFRVKSPNSPLPSLLANYPTQNLNDIHMFSCTISLALCFSVSIIFSTSQLHNSQASTGHRRHVDQLTREGIRLCDGARRTKETSEKVGARWMGTPERAVGDVQSKTSFFFWGGSGWKTIISIIYVIICQYIYIIYICVCVCYEEY